MPPAVQKAGDFFYGNPIASVVYGSADDAAQTAVTNSTDVITKAMGKPAKLVALNIGGRGASTRAMQSASALVRSRLDAVGTVLNGGINSRVVWAVNTGMMVAAAAGCSH